MLAANLGYDTSQLRSKSWDEFGGLTVFNQAAAARLQGGLNARLGQVDLGAAGLLLVHGQRRQCLQQIGYLTALAQVTRLGIFQLGRCRRGFEIALRRQRNMFEVVHAGNSVGTIKKGRPCVTASC